MGTGQPPQVSGLTPCRPMAAWIAIMIRTTRVVRVLPDNDLHCQTDEVGFLGEFDTVIHHEALVL